LGPGAHRFAGGDVGCDCRQLRVPRVARARARAADARYGARVRFIHLTGSLTIAELIDVVRDAALEKKGEDFIAIDVAGRTILADAFALVTGRSKIQTRAIADAIVERCEIEGLPVRRVEGYSDGSWILLDLGNVIVNVFTPDQRQFYNLERLWSEVEKRQAQGS
jgi:ribosome-associated protein